MGVVKRKTLWGSLSLGITLSLALAGCGGNTDNSNAVVNQGTKDPASNAANADNGSAATASDDLKPITISAFIGSPNQQPTADNRIYKKIQDELGVKLNMEFLVGDLQQKLGVMIAGGEYPDLISADPKLVTAKAVIPLEDLIDKYGPHLKEHYAAYWNRMKDSSDGHIYWLPNYGAYTGETHSNSYSGPAFWIQKNILKEAGYPTPTTLDDYFKLISDYAEKHPTIDGQPTIGYTTLAYGWQTFGLLNAPEHLSGHANDGGVVVDDGVASVFATADIAKTYYKKLNDVYNQGLMDKEAFVQNADQYNAKISSGRVLGMFDQHWNFQGAENELVAQNKIGETYVGFPLTYDGVKDHYLDRGVINLNNGFGISKDAKDPIRIIKFLDAQLDEKWQKILQWGEEGVDYQVDENGKFFRTPEQRKQQEDPAWKLANKAEALLGYAPKIEGTYSDGNATDAGSQPDEFYASLKPEDKELLDAYHHKTWSEFFSPAPENPVYYPAWQIDLIDGSDASVANKQMSDASLKYLPRAIMSKSDKFDSVWQDYVNAYKKINVKAYEDRINAQIQWRIQNWTSK
ncbi:sugar ABC transporter substrate-binding protein [Paenibacillus sacheonensis]|uniref:Sugar ABC transporter substrate-binding protein n=1 Tax=Paenibacillus sacheonensis TaxID=742054 RepID=A0A7X4YLL2_9BACL|nr:sugar ABC transporter substrate-binding protein [Paenibacillus sacheonensis]MBM7566074.1 putative aldouronate transport system substrate-binding protein [Paenibacillus sacheonensis]NBC68617.1 sugar ABC transporter substrate-binding protein [Paenibacillus sacheonensis]